MSIPIPTSTSLTESAVINAPLEAVWHQIKLSHFDDWWTALKGSEHVKGVSDDTDIVKWFFEDGSIWEIKQEAHSTIDYYVTYSTISAHPAQSYSSVLSTIRLYPVTSGPLAKSTFVQWSATFSGDASAEVIQDARYKRQDALADLAMAVEK